MGLFDLFTPKKELTEEQRKWNLIWDLWAEGKADSPYAQLLDILEAYANSLRL